MNRRSTFLFLGKSPPDQRVGFALVISLCALVLITILVLAFFSKALLNRQLSFSSTNLAKADALARTSLDFIISELREEIIDPARSVALDGGNPSYLLVYQPLDKKYTVPQKIGTDIPNPDPIGARTIAKVSAKEMALRPGGTITASPVLISAPSLNSRYFNSARWFGTGGPGLGSQATLPAWFYTTRNNGVKTPSFLDGKNPAHNDYVIGRFACTVYDVSGMLNANVAGYSSAAAPNPYASGKSSTAYAELDVLDDGLANNSFDSKKFVQWRNGVSDTATDAAYDNYLKSFGTEHGFLEAKEGHNAFVSRKDLLNAAKSAASLIPLTATSYLSHYSRSLNAPSWGPSNPAGSTVDYETPANNAGGINRFVANVRYPSAANIVHYRDDGTIEPYSATETAFSYKVQPGDPAIQKRFSLSKLAWIGPGGPNAAAFAPGADKSKAIEDCFGLRWDASNYRWEYAAAKPPPGVSIKTLEMVASERREPNFFELLNAGILKGSLGRDPGLGIENTSIPEGVGVHASNFDTYKAEPNLHILQIGANIIDQYDTDSYPTAIHFDAFGLTGADDLSIQTVYGGENLPGLFGICPIAIADPAPAGGGSNGTIKYWLQPSIWNPHQMPTNTPTDYPSGFRAYAYGQAIGMWQITSSTNAKADKKPKPGPVTIYDDGTGSAQTPAGAGEIYFTDTGNTASPFYLRPRPLTLNLANVSFAGTPSANIYDSKWSALPGDISPANQFVGFSLKPDPGYNPDPVTKDTVSKYVLPNPVLYMSLQYKGPDNQYHPYNFMARIAQPRINTLGRPGKYLKPSPEGNPPTAPRASIDGQTQAAGWGPTRPDPRTDRFSAATQWWGQSPFDRSMNFGRTNYIDAQGDSSSVIKGYGIPYTAGFSYIPAYIPTSPPVPVQLAYISLWSNNDPSFSITTVAGIRNAYYADPDGVIRYGDGYRSNTGNTGSGDGCQLFQGDTVVTPTSSLANVQNGSAQARRPVILNRPFRSVGEIGFAYRDLPFKTLDLSSSKSADGALLDLFSVGDQPEVSAGQINPSSTPVAVLQAVLAGTSKNNNDPNVKIYNTSANLSIDAASAANLANQIVVNLSGSNGPYGSRADLAPRLEDPVKLAFDTTNVTTANWANKAHREAPARAFAEATNIRTWNLLIDLVAQTGALPPASTDLKNFTVQGERRYWLHVSIDRFTGRIVDQQLEPVYE